MVLPSTESITYIDPLWDAHILYQVDIIMYENKFSVDKTIVSFHNMHDLSLSKKIIKHGGLIIINKY